jgi:hypothetical protein
MNDPDFLDLCARILDGRAPAEDFRRWNHRIETDSRQRRLYRDFCAQVVGIEEELAEEIQPRAIQPVRRLATLGRLTAAAALLVTAGAWWWQRNGLTDEKRSDQVEVIAFAPDSAPGAPSAFTYPFDGFPHLELQTLEADLNPELRVVALDEIDPRIVTIAQRLAGFELSGELEL